MKLTATSLRENIYAILDQVLASGEAVEIERNGRTLRLQRSTRARGWIGWCLSRITSVVIRTTSLNSTGPKNGPNSRHLS